jgi:hypothetical protein
VKLSRGEVLVAVSLAALLIFFPEAASAQDPCAPQNPNFTESSNVNSIRLNGSGEGRQSDLVALNNAAGMWNFCDGLPSITTSQSGDLTINVVFYLGPNLGQIPNCGTQCGCRQGNTIHIFESNQNGTRDCTLTWDSLIAHELGHVLGLNNAGSGCSGCRIMGNTACGPSVTPSDCSAADAFWWTSEEGANDPEPNEDEQAPPDGTPILIDLDRNGLQLTGLEEGVVFDIDADGHLEQVAWTSPGELDGFLVRELDGDGVISSGLELYGDATALLSGGRASHGYEALAELDRPEFLGNGNGRIDAGDLGYGELAVWVDADHNGVSTAAELSSLSDLGIEVLALWFVETRFTDQHGNEFRYNSLAWERLSGGGLLPLWCSDVVFQMSD